MKEKLEEKLSFGDVNGLMELLVKIAFRQGIGDVLAEGGELRKKN